MNKIFKALTLSLALTAGLTACQSQTSEVTTTGEPAGTNMAPDVNIPADTTGTEAATAPGAAGSGTMESGTTEPGSN